MLKYLRCLFTVNKQKTTILKDAIKLQEVLISSYEGDCVKIKKLIEKNNLQEQLYFKEIYEYVNASIWYHHIHK